MDRDNNDQSNSWFGEATPSSSSAVPSSKADDMKRSASSVTDSSSVAESTAPKASGSKSSNAGSSESSQSSHADRPKSSKDDSTASQTVTPEFANDTASSGKSSDGQKSSDTTRHWIIGIVIAIIVIFGFVAFHHGGSKGGSQSAQKSATTSQLSSQIKGNTYKETNIIDGKKETNADNPKLKFIGDTQSESILGKKVLTKNKVQVKGNTLVTYRTDRVPKNMLKAVRKSNPNISANGVVHSQYAVKQIKGNGKSETFIPLYSVMNGKKSNVPHKQAVKEKTLLTKD